MSGWDKFLVTIFICIVLVYIFAEGVGMKVFELNSDCVCV
jgi:hypothetical protein